MSDRFPVPEGTWERRILGVWGVLMLGLGVVGGWMLVEWLK